MLDDANVACSAFTKLLQLPQCAVACAVAGASGLWVNFGHMSSALAGFCYITEHEPDHVPAPAVKLHAVGQAEH